MTQMPSLRERIAIHEAAHATAALTFGIPIISVTIEDRPHLHRGHYHVDDASFGLEAIVTLCLSGPEAEREFCGPADDDGARLDVEAARDHIADHRQRGRHRQY
jgi:hypothetical protein